MRRLALLVFVCSFCGLVGCDWFAASDPLAPRAVQVRNLLLDPEPSSESSKSSVKATANNDPPAAVTLRIGVVDDAALYHQLAPLGDAMGMSLSNTVFESETTEQRDRGNRSIQVCFVEATLSPLTLSTDVALSTNTSIQANSTSVVDARSCDLVILPTSQLCRIGDASIPFPVYFTGDLREFETLTQTATGTDDTGGTQRGGAADLRRMSEIFHQLQTKWVDLFPLIQSKQTRWGANRVAMPLGVAMPIWCLRSDLLSSQTAVESTTTASPNASAPPTTLPQTWSQFTPWAVAIQNRLKNASKSSSNDVANPAPAGQASETASVMAEFVLLEPMAGQSAAESLFTRAAPYLVHRSQFSTFFQLATMEPMLGEPAMRRALAEMVRQYEDGTSEQRDFVCSATPQMVSEALRTGRTLSVILSPTAAYSTAWDDAVKGAKLSVRFAPVPGSDEVFNPTSQAWERRGERESKQMPYLSDGRVIVVTPSCATPRIAQRLAIELSSTDSNRPLLASSETTGPFRFTDETFATSWCEPWVSTNAAVERVRVVRRLANSELGLPFPAIEGRGDYLTALAEEIRAAIRGEKTSDAALDAATLRWNEITEKYGRDTQKATYRKSLGL